MNLQPRIPVRIGGFLFPAVRVSPDGLSAFSERISGGWAIARHRLPFDLRGLSLQSLPAELSPRT